MTQHPPCDPLTDDHFAAAGADSSAFQTMSRRADFLRAASARRHGTPGFLLQARQRAAGEAEGVRVGYTCSKKLGNAVVRNRAKRRLRALARLVLSQRAQSGWDYVLVGRPGATITRDFRDLAADLDSAMDRMHGTGA